MHATEGAVEVGRARRRLSVEGLRDTVTDERALETFLTDHTPLPRTENDDRVAQRTVRAVQRSTSRGQRVPDRAVSASLDFLNSRSTPFTHSQYGFT